MTEDLRRAAAALLEVLGRRGRDATAEELALLDRLQRLLAAGPPLGRSGTAERPAPVVPQARRPGTCRALTARERTVLVEVAQGATAARAARALGVTSATVNRHLQNAYRKLGVHDRVSAVRRAEELGLVPLPGADSAAHPRALVTQHN